MNNWRFLRETSFWCRPARCALRVTALQEAWHVTLLWHGSRTIGHLQLSIDTHIVSPQPSCPTARTSFTPVWRRHLLRLVWISLVIVKCDCFRMTPRAAARTCPSAGPRRCSPRTRTRRGRELRSLWSRYRDAQMLLCWTLSYSPTLGTLNLIGCKF